MNLMDGLHEKLKRAKELQKHYESINTGTFGVAVIEQAIDRAELSIRNGDTIGMLKSYNELEKLE